MSAKSCLLCGKALSRIWVGSGEDFCSREHRNQYRLRRGMDRLLEANKLASLMRRRENLKPIPVPAPTAESDLGRHVFEKIQAATRPQTPAVRLIRPEMGPRFPAAGLQRFTVLARPGAPRGMAVPLRSAARLKPIRSKALAPPLTGLQGSSAWQPVPQTSQRGLELRVCLASGFRVRSPLRRNLKAVSPAAAGLTVPKVVAHVRPSDIGRRTTLLEIHPPFQARTPERIEPPMPWQDLAMNWPGLQPVPLARQACWFAPRQAPAAPYQFEDQQVRMPSELLQPGGLPSTRPPRIFAIPASPSTSPTAVRSAAVPFKPADSPYGYGSEESELQ